MTGALSGVTILDMSRVLAGPYAAMVLGDLGARVIKVERPHIGDDTRRWGPPFTESGESTYFFCANRNKESIAVNLKHPLGVNLIRRLVPHVDVIVENFRVGTLDSYGLSYESLRQLNAGLILCSITGYGQTGPDRMRPGYDNVIQAQGGIMSVTGPAQPGEPYKVGVAVADITTGLHAAIAILAALRHRSVTGEGQQIDIALFDSQLSWLANLATGYLATGDPPQRYGNAHPSIVPYQTMATQDGWLMLAVGNDRQFAKLCDLLEHSEWVSDSRFETNDRRVQNRHTLIPMLQRIFVERASKDWASALDQAGIPNSPVYDIPTALADPQAVARDMVQTVVHPSTGPISLLGPVPKMSATPSSIQKPPPLLGEHTDAVLAEFLSLTQDEVQELRSLNAIT